MSNVTDLILVTSVIEEEGDVRQWLERTFDEIGAAGKAPVNCRDPEGGRWYGGTKVLQLEAYIGAYNYFPLGDLLARMGSHPWRDIANVRLFVQEEHGDEMMLAWGPDLRRYVPESS